MNYQWRRWEAAMCRLMLLVAVLFSIACTQSIAQNNEPDPPRKISESQVATGETPSGINPTVKSVPPFKGPFNPQDDRQTLLVVMIFGFDIVIVVLQFFLLLKSEAF